MSRYAKLNKDGTLAHRLNRAQPNAANFPEAQLRENVDVGKLETSTKYSAAHTSNALTNINVNQSSERFLTGRNDRTHQTPKPLTAVASGGFRRVPSQGGDRVSRTRANAQRGHYSTFGDMKASLRMSGGWPAELKSEAQLSSSPQHADLAYSPDLESRAKSTTRFQKMSQKTNDVANSMDMRNHWMRSEAKLREQNYQLIDKVNE